MASYLLLWIALISIYGYATSYTIPYKRPCRNISPECVKDTLQAAIPFFAEGSQELGLEPLDPYVVDILNLTLSGISITFSEGTASGLRTCIIDFARVVEETLEFQAHCNISIKGKYRSTGHLLSFPIDGDGMSTIKCENMRVHCVLKLATKSNNVNYLEVKSYNVKNAYDGKVTYYITNLFKRNHEMSKALLKFMNSNWRMVAEEFGAPLVEFGEKTFIRNIRRFLDVVPLNDLRNL